MSVYKRAEWRSGLTYQNECPLCRTIIRYTDYDLGFRPWYPDGFVYCPRCQKPLRHNENLAIDPQTGKKIYETHSNVNNDRTSTKGAKNAFCTSCGNKFEEKDSFCGACGAKR